MTRDELVVYLKVAGPAFNMNEELSLMENMPVYTEPSGHVKLVRDEHHWVLSSMDGTVVIEQGKNWARMALDFGFHLGNWQDTDLVLTSIVIEMGGRWTSPPYSR